MNNLTRYISIVIFTAWSFSSVKSQDLPVMHLSVGAVSNVSLFSNGINNGGGYLSLEYLINRNIFAGIQADYSVAQHNVQLNNPSFANGITFPGDTLEVKENISKLNASIYAGYKFFPLSTVSFNLALSLGNINLERDFKNNEVLNDDAINWYTDNWASNSASVLGISASVDFYLKKSVMLRAGVNYQDITNALFEDRDQNIVKEISYTDGKISSLIMHEKAYQPMDVYIALVFKLGLKKL